MGEESIRIERTVEVSKVVLDRPPLNVLGIADLRALGAAFENVRKDKSKVVVLAAQGKAFSAGVDIKDHTLDKVNTMMTAMREAFEKLWALKQPTVCVVQGAALGGGMELALACDFIIASQDAKFGLPEIKVGVFPPIACLLLPRFLPWPQAIELILTGEAIDAKEACRLGLINRVVPAEELETEANALNSKLIDLSGSVLKFAKRAALKALELNWPKTLVEIERIYLDELMKLEDAQEGLRAFMEKRKPHWKEC